MAHHWGGGPGSSNPGKCLLVWTLLETAINPTTEPVDSKVGMPQVKQLTGREHRPTHEQTIGLKFYWAWLPLVAQTKATAYNVGDPGLSLGWEDSLEKEMATHSSTLAWKIPRMEEPSRLQTMGLQRVGHNWATSLSLSLLLSMALPTDQDSIFPKASPSHQEAYTSLLLSLIHQRSDRRSKKNYTRKLIKMKVNQNESQMRQNKSPEN